MATSSARTRLWILSCMLAVALGLLIWQTSGVARVAAAPGVVEWIDYGGLMSEGPGSIFYAARQDTDTNFCNQVPDTYVYGRVPNGFGQALREQFLTGCDAIQALGIAAGSSHLYYTFNNLGTVQLWRQPIDGSGTAVLLDTHVEPGALALDAHHLYYAKSSAPTSLERGIWRVPLGDPATPEQVVQLIDITGNRIYRLLVDSNKVYWTEGFEDQIGAVRVALKNGGPPAGIAMNGVEGAFDLAVDSTYLYWSELGGRIMRWPKVGGAAQEIHTAEMGVRAIDVNDGLLVFTQGNGRDGSIWRVPAGGGPAEPLASEQANPSDIALVDGWIYWIGGGFKRLNAAADPIELDYVVDWVEVTQAVQNGNNSLSLAALRATYVRVYAHEATGESGALVRAALYGKTPGGADLPGSPLISGYLDIPAVRPSRADADQTFNFTLPEEWVRVGTISLDVVVNPLHNNDQAFETVKTNNQYKVTPDIALLGRAICIVSTRVAAETVFGPLELYDETSLEYALILERAGSVLPAPLAVAPTGQVVWKGDGSVFDLREKADREELKATLGTYAAMGNDPFACGEGFTAVFGIVHENAYMKPGTSGSGFFSPPVFWAQLKDSGSPDYNYPSRGLTVAHEIAAHSMGNGHVGCGVDPQDNNYDPPVCQLDDSDDEDSHWGYDGITETGINPVDHADFRSYGSPEWVSYDTWNKVGDFAALRGALLAEAAQPVEGEVVLIGGLIEPDGSAGELGPAYVLLPEEISDGMQRMLAASAAAQGTAAEFTLELLSENGKVLYTRPFDVAHQVVDADDAADIEEGDRLSFHLVMPYDPQTAVIRLKKGGTVLDLIEQSESAPSISKPVAALGSDGQLRVEWDARDADGDDLTHTVWVGQVDDHGSPAARRAGTFAPALTASHYMTDVIPFLPTRLTSVALPGNLIPGMTQARALVLTTDGLRTTRELSDPFVIPPKLPFAHILHPATDVTVLDGEAVKFVATAFDPDDGPLNGRSLQWLVNGQAEQTGRWFTTADLPPGVHEVMLVASDSDNNRVREVRQVTVEERPLPGPTGPLQPEASALLPVVVRP